MDNLKLNTKPELNINFNDLPPGSYVIKDGKLLPNPNDEAMMARMKKDDKGNVIFNDVKKAEVLPAKDADISDA